MYCRNCGNTLDNKMKYCNKCGTKIENKINTSENIQYKEYEYYKNRIDLENIDINKIEREKLLENSSWR